MIARNRCHPPTLLPLLVTLISLAIFGGELCADDQATGASAATQESARKSDKGATKANKKTKKTKRKKRQPKADGQEDSPPKDGPNKSQQPGSSRKGILANAYDFTNPPVIPEFEHPRPAQIRAAMERGIQFLIDNQNSNGSWGSATKTKSLNIYAPVPGAHHAFRAATTSLCISALIEVAPENKQAMLAVDKAETWLIEHIRGLRRASGDALYNVWGHAYSIQALVRMWKRHCVDSAKREEIEALIRQQFDMLSRYESVDGGWGYYDFRYQLRKPTSDSISFVNGAVLVAFAEAQAIGVEPPAKIVKRAVAATKRQQKPDFSYLYGEYLKNTPMRGINRPGGSLGRTQCCNIAMRMWGDERITDNVMKNWLYRLYVRNGWLDIGRKRPIPHESWFQVAGYFYYFGHYYGALCVESLPEQERGPYQAMLARLILDRQEKNGSWWDYPLYNYHPPYGTGFALMTLGRCLPAEE